MCGVFCVVFQMADVFVCFLFFINLMTIFFVVVFLNFLLLVNHIPEVCFYIGRWSIFTMITTIMICAIICYSNKQFVTTRRFLFL